jgi:hypothetical protein
VPVPSGQFRNRESIDGTDNSDGHNAPVQATRFNSVVLPDEMEYDHVIRGIEMVTVLCPTASAQVDLHAASTKLASVEEDERVTKIRPETVALGATVNNLQSNAVSRLESRRYRSRVPGSAQRDLGDLRRFAHSCLSRWRLGSGYRSLVILCQRS